MKFRSVLKIARFSVFLAAATLNSLTHAEEIIGETSFNSYFSVGLIAAGFIALVVMRRRNLPLE